MREAAGHGCRGGGSREKTSTLAYSGATPCKYEWLLWRWHAPLCFLAVYWERAWDFSRTWARGEGFCRRPSEAWGHVRQICRGRLLADPELGKNQVNIKLRICEPESIERRRRSPWNKPLIEVYLCVIPPVTPGSIIKPVKLIMSHCAQVRHRSFALGRASRKNAQHDTFEGSAVVMR